MGSSTGFTQYYRYPPIIHDSKYQFILDIWDYLGQFPSKPNKKPSHQPTIWGRFTSFQRGVCPPINRNWGWFSIGCTTLNLHGSLQVFSFSFLWFIFYLFFIARSVPQRHAKVHVRLHRNSRCHVGEQLSFKSPRKKESTALNIFNDGQSDTVG